MTSLNVWRIVAVAALAFCATNVQASQLWGTYSGGSGSVGLNLIDISTGAVGPFIDITAVGGAVTDDMASDPVRQPGVIWGVRTPLAGSQLVSIDPFSQQLLATTVLNAPSPMRTLAIDPTDGMFYGATTTDLYVINKNTGVTKLVGPTTMSVTNALGFDSLGNLFGIAGNNVLVSVNTLTGTTSTIATLSLRMEDLAVDPQTGVMYGLGYGPPYRLYQIDTNNGALTVVGPSLGRPAGMAFTDVPEPTAATLALIALLAVAAHSHRRAVMG